MTRIQLHNTRTRRKEEFAPLDPANVRMYVCGPTVYDRAHLGNARPVVVFDVLYRLLRHVYGADAVTYVRNFTDVDDKINARAAETDREIGAITDETIAWFIEDMGDIGALEPDLMPRATEYIDEMKAMIATLIEKGFAYSVRDHSNNPPADYVLADREAMLAEHALFEVRKYPEYGQLSGRSLDDMIAGARVEVAPYKRDPMDFVLWKPSGEGQPGWNSPWGWGRPGWHIECSAMSKALLGDRFDIHGGGNDLMFPHHENERAQSCCANDTEEMAQVWMHNEMLQVEGKKMSKSLGNFFTVRNLLDQGVPGEVIRFVFLSTHYRKPMDWTERKREEAVNHMSKWHTLERRALSKKLSEDDVRKYVDTHVIEALKNDLNTPLAMTRVKKLAGLAYSARQVDAEDTKRFFATLRFLGFVDLNVHRLRPAYHISRAIKEVLGDDEAARTDEMMDALMREKIAKWRMARSKKDWLVADRLRDGFADLGIKVDFASDGEHWEFTKEVDMAKLEALE